MKEFFSDVVDTFKSEPDFTVATGTLVTGIATRLSGVEAGTELIVFSATMVGICEVKSIFRQTVSRISEWRRSKVESVSSVPTVIFESEILSSTGSGLTNSELIK